MHATNCEASSEWSVNSIAPRNLIGSHLVLSARPVNPPLRSAPPRVRPPDARLSSVSAPVISDWRRRRPRRLWRSQSDVAVRTSQTGSIEQRWWRPLEKQHCAVLQWVLIELTFCIVNYLIVIILRQRCYRMSPSISHQVNEFTHHQLREAFCLRVDL